MSSEGIVSWDRYYYASVGLFTFAFLTGFFNKTISFILWIVLISLLTEIPGCINHYLSELNLGEFFGVLLAIHFGGIKIGLLFIIYIMFLPVLSRSRTPSGCFISATSNLIAFALVPFLYNNVLGQNLLLTLYSYSAIMYSIHFVQTSIFSPGMIAKWIQESMIAIPIAYLSNMVYVGAFQNRAMQMFNPTLNFPTMLKILLFVALLFIGIIIILKKYSFKKRLVNKT